MRVWTHLIPGVCALALVLCLVACFERFVLHVEQTSPIGVFLKCETLVIVLFLAAIAVTHALHWIQSMGRKIRHVQRTKPTVSWTELFQLMFLLAISALIIVGVVHMLGKSSINSG